MQDLTDKVLSEIGIVDINLSGHRIRRQELDEAIDQNGVLHGRTYLLAENIRRHDWQRSSGNCLYSVDTNDGTVKLPAEELLGQFTGVYYALWQYWGERTRLREAHVTRYVNEAPAKHDVFFRAIVYHWLDDAHWLRLWRSRRASGRA